MRSALLAANRGPYSDQGFAANCRELAWKTISGMCGMETDNPDLIEKEFLKCQLVSYTTEKGYFSHICTDLGLLCIRRDLQTVSVLAYSDCD